ncbi:MAG: hypothetical protein QM811_15850 [Pirellulales bacterium]
MAFRFDCRPAGVVVRGECSGMPEGTLLTRNGRPALGEPHGAGIAGHGGRRVGSAQHASRPVAAATGSLVRPVAAGDG